MSAFHFTRKELEPVSRTLGEYLNMKAPHCAAVLDNLEQGKLVSFGYGSLIADPHAGYSEEYPGVLKGYMRDACFKDRHLRGIPHMPGITMGLVPAKGKQVRGLVRVTDIKNFDNHAEFIRQTMQNVYKYAAREVSRNPIYRFTMQPIEIDRGVIYALVCDTSVHARQYIGATISHPHDKLFTFEEKAAIMAVSHGDLTASPLPSVRPTGYGYWQFVGPYTATLLSKQWGIDWQMEPRIKKLVRMMNGYRQVLKEHMPELIKPLEAVENTEERRKFTSDVYLADQAALDTSAEDISAYIASARRKLGNEDYLTAKQANQNEQRIRELGRLIA